MKIPRWAKTVWALVRWAPHIVPLAYRRTRARAAAIRHANDPWHGKDVPCQDYFYDHTEWDRGAPYAVCRCGVRAVHHRWR